MNKRMKKKWSRIERLENKVAQLMAENMLLMDAVRRQTGLIEEMNAVNSRNVEATNNRFDEMETYQKILEDNLKDLEKKQSKKSWFGRR